MPRDAQAAADQDPFVAPGMADEAAMRAQVSRVSACDRHLFRLRRFFLIDHLESPFQTGEEVDVGAERAVDEAAIMSVDRGKSLSRARPDGRKLHRDVAPGTAMAAAVLHVQVAACRLARVPNQAMLESTHSCIHSFDILPRRHTLGLPASMRRHGRTDFSQSCIVSMQTTSGQNWLAMASESNSQIEAATPDKAERLRGKHPIEDVLYDRLLDAIIDKFLRPGQHLNEVKLAERYLVPRSRVRRVLERLRDEDVVQFELNRGAFISRPTVAEAKAVFEARRHLENVIIRLVCERGRPEDMDQLAADIREEEEAFAAQRPDVNRIAARFHFSLARMSGNPVLEKMAGQLIRRCILVQSVYERKTGILCLTGEHGQLVGLIRQRDADAAARLMDHHFDHIVGSLDLSEARRLEIDPYEFMGS